MSYININEKYTKHTMYTKRKTHKLCHTENIHRTNNLHSNNKSNTKEQSKTTQQSKISKYTEHKLNITLKKLYTAQKYTQYKYNTIHHITKKKHKQSFYKVIHKNITTSIIYKTTHVYKYQNKLNKYIKHMKYENIKQYTKQQKIIK